MNLAEIPRSIRLHWTPLPKHELLLRCPADDILFGGARGGGKTDGVLGDWAEHSYDCGRYANGIIIRRSMVELEDMIRRSQQIYPQTGASFNRSRRMWTMPSGAELRFRYLEKADDAMAYQGHQYTRVYPEEAGNWPTPRAVDLMFATLRSAQGIHCKMISTANPGGPGHQWLKQRYVMPARLGNRLIRVRLDELERDIYRCFIPSKLEDNPYLGKDYAARLHLVGSAALVRAWLTGDWDAVEGAYFDTWSEEMILPNFTPPAGWVRFMSMDWGYAKPFSVGWWCVAEHEAVEIEGQHVWFPAGALIRYREWYGCARKASGEVEPNVGLRMEAEEIARGILQRELGDAPIAYREADPSMWDSSKGPSMAERMLKYLPGDKDLAARAKACPLLLRKADNERIAGWSQMRARMRGNEDGLPMIYVQESCVDSIRTIPVLQHDEAKPEDLDDEAEDHAADEWRYAAMSRPYGVVRKAKRLPRHPHTMDLVDPMLPSTRRQRLE